MIPRYFILAWVIVYLTISMLFFIERIFPFTVSMEYNFSFEAINSTLGWWEMFPSLILIMKKSIPLSDSAFKNTHCMQRFGISIQMQKISCAELRCTKLLMGNIGYLNVYAYGTPYPIKHSQSDSVADAVIFYSSWGTNRLHLSMCI